jgi:hypothetical protein
MRSKINRFGIIAAVVASTLAFVPNAFAKHVKPPKGGGVATTPCGDGTITWGPISLWPPNHKLVGIHIQFAENESPADGDTIGLQINDISFNQQSADDDGASGCGKPTSKQGSDFGFHTAVVSGPDSGPISNDIVLRAERCSRLGARVYLIDVTCSDDGGTDDVTLAVTVPKSRGHAVSSSSN